jgi:hypothetical protein
VGFCGIRNLPFDTVIKRAETVIKTECFSPFFDSILLIS